MTFIVVVMDFVNYENTDSISKGFNNNTDRFFDIVIHGDTFWNTACSTISTYWNRPKVSSRFFVVRSQSQQIVTGRVSFAVERLVTGAKKSSLISFEVAVIIEGLVQIAVLCHHPTLTLSLPSQNRILELSSQSSRLFCYVWGSKTVRYTLHMSMLIQNKVVNVSHKEAGAEADVQIIMKQKYIGYWIKLSFEFSSVIDLYIFYLFISNFSCP